MNKISIIKVKGKGFRATYKIIFFNKSWHIKLRPNNDKKILYEEEKKIKYAKEHLNVTQTGFVISIPFVSFLITKTLEGFPAFNLIDKINSKKLIITLSEILLNFQNTKLDGYFPFKPPEWSVNNMYCVEQIINLNLLKLKGKKLHPDFEQLSQNELLNIINFGKGMKIEKKVLCHGDFCMPNILISESGVFSGIIDIGQLHENDYRIDLAILSWCIKDNMGIKCSNYFLNIFGFSNESVEILYYRLAYDLSLNFPKPWEWVNSPSLINQRNKIEKIFI